MKGLLYDNFYKTSDSMKLFGCLVAAMAAGVLLTGSDTVLELFVYVAITMLSANSVAGLRKDAEAKWMRYERTLPVRRADVVRAKFLSYLIWTAIGTAVAAVVTGLALLIHGNIFFVYGLRDAVSLFSLGIGIALLCGALFYPLAYLLGPERSETVLIVSVLGAVGLAAGLIYLVNRGAELAYYVRLGIFGAACAGLFGLAYAITEAIYIKKDF